VTEVVLLADERISAVPVSDCGEPLVDLRTVASVEVDGRQADAGGAYAQAREGAVRLLLRAECALPAGYRIVVVEGYRPLELQARYFDEHVAVLRERHPDWTAARLSREASRYISPPAVAPHLTGGALDLTLRGPDGRLCWMGTEVNASPEECDCACYTDADNISSEARANRATLRTAMTMAGFVNYPTEWWHWSVGERYWAFVSGAAVARYGPVTD
jgi:zinc D-Ala-D-Ala dipeptidase